MDTAASRMAPYADAASLRRSRPPRTLTILSLLAGHCIFSVALIYYPAISQVHALGTLLLGLGTALLAKRPNRLFWIAAYIAGFEVLWRMSGAELPWEFAKYAVTLILVIGLFRFYPRREGILLPAVYLLALAPSAILSFQEISSANGVREALSFNLSGPLSLAAAVMFFRQVRITRVQATTILWALVIPVAGIATRTLQSIVTADRIDFTTESNFQTSGGFGPNQVSAALGLGALAAILLVVLEKRGLLRLAAFGAFFWFLAQAFLTFSRGGVYNLAIAGVLVLFVAARGRGRRIGSIVLISSILIVFALVILPKLEDFTDDTLRPRFTSTDTTQRSELASTELQIWRSTPLTGVGPGGLAESADRVSGDPVAAHTEYTRLLAEHGIGGLIALGALLVMAFRAWRRAPSTVSEIWTVALLAWSLAEMSHAAMRLAAIGLCFGLAMVVIKQPGFGGQQQASRSSSTNLRPRHEGATPPPIQAA